MKLGIIVIAVLGVFSLAGTAEATHVPQGRVYISPIVGDGSEENPYTAAVCQLQYNVRCRNAIGSQPEGAQRGHPLMAWSLTYVDTRNPATGLQDWTAYDALNDPFIVLLSNDLQATVPSNEKTRVRQSGALTQAELNTVTTYYSLLDAMLRKQYPLYGPGIVEAQFHELFE